MEFDWEEFEEGQHVETRKQIHVTINGAGRIFFNALALEALGDPDGVTLLYDQGRSVIGVKPSPLHRKSSYQLRLRNPPYTRGKNISAKNFCRRFSINPEETLAFTDAKMADGILILDLNEVRSARKL